MDIRQYIAAAERTYSYRIKTAFPLNDPEMSQIEKVISKYDPHNLTNPKKTMFQSQPLDFPNVQNAEVYIVDAELGLPVSPSVLIKEIAFNLGVPDKFVVVRGVNDPTELETQRLMAEPEMDEEAEKSGKEPGALLTDPSYSEVDAVDGGELYGEKHNSRLLKYLNTVEQDREEASKVDPASPLFKWLNMPKTDVESEDFNKDIKDAPKVAPEAAADPVEKSPYGNLDDNKAKFRRVYKTKKTENSVAERDAEPVRKGKK